MLILKSNEEIGTYLKKLILSKYPSCRKFCKAYLLVENNASNEEDLHDDDVNRLANRLSQILKGIKSIQTYDLPIFSYLLGVSCEQMLSAGAICEPIHNRKTNYDIAFSTDEHDWEEYINREDRIASYADEFGKTVVDYAIEFNNYGLIKFLINNGYISLISQDESYFSTNFGASTTLKLRQYQEKTLQNELYHNKILRTQIISLALKHNDYDILDEMKAREIPPQQNISSIFKYPFSSSDYYDEDFINAILHSNQNVIDYFCEEYSVKSFHKEEHQWLFPFIDKLIIRALEENNKNTETLLNSAINHNENTYVNLSKAILHEIKQLKDNNYEKYAIDCVFEYFDFDEINNVVRFNCYHSANSKKIATNVIFVDIRSANTQLQDKINKLNELYSQIANLKDYLSKN